MEETRIITSSITNRRKLHLKKLWSYRSIIVAFVRRDIRAHYAQTRLGIVWSVVQALTAAAIIQVFFGVLLQVTIPGIPYILYAFPGMMAWYFFSYIVNNSGTSLLQSQHLIKKVYFPKLVLPLYKSLVGLVELLVWMLVFAVLLLFFSYPIGLRLLLIPLCVLLNMIAGLSIAIWLSALTVRYRDMSHIIPYLVGFGIFVTPVFFATTMIPNAYQFLVYFNPMAGVIELYRWSILGTGFSTAYLWGLIPCILLLVSGLFYFRRVESTMADLV